MRRVVLLLAFLLGSAHAAGAGVLVHIDKATQRMMVAVDGAPAYMWRVSTGRGGAPSGPTGPGGNGGNVGKGGSGANGPGGGTAGGEVPTPQPPPSKQACMDDGYSTYGFINQGQCVATWEHASH